MERRHGIIMNRDMHPEYISVISNSHCARIRIDDIELIEQDGRKLHVITRDRDYSFYENISEIVVSLVGRAFYRPVKGLVINFDHVRDISGNNISFQSGQAVTLGRNSIAKTRAAYKRYLQCYPPYSLWEREVRPVSYVAEGSLTDYGDFGETKNPGKISEK